MKFWCNCFSERFTNLSNHFSLMTIIDGFKKLFNFIAYTSQVPCKVVTFKLRTSKTLRNKLSVGKPNGGSAEFFTRAGSYDSV